MKSILIVEDEPSFAKTLVFALEKEGYHAVSKPSAVEALEYCSTSTPDLILSDHESLTLMEKLIAIPFVLITASADEAVFSRAKQLGAKACLVKPVKLEALLKIVRDLVQKK